MDVAPAGDSSFRRGSEDNFTGEVWLRPTVSSDDGTNLGIVHFSPGARTHWHRHPGGQFLYAITGKGRVRSRGEQGHVLEPGDVIYADGASWHFHGAGPDAPMAHVAVNIRGAPEWGEAVTDEEYDEGF
jgi:quercetin dioxygenase-like cupin family protein